jgi:menaquinone-dependent protoporphyrinogen oxidase
MVRLGRAEILRSVDACVGHSSEPPPGTWEIAEAIAAGLTARGIEADPRPLGEIEGVEEYDIIVLGSAIYLGRWLKQARKFAHDHAQQLKAKQVWLFSSGPVEAPGAHARHAEPADALELERLTGAVEHRLFPGKLDRERLALAEKLVAAAANAPDSDTRDWESVDAFAAHISMHAPCSELRRGEH